MNQKAFGNLRHVRKTCRRESAKVKYTPAAVPFRDRIEGLPRCNVRTGRVNPSGMDCFTAAQGYRISNEFKRLF
ncbi:hypothetical protein UCMB321_4270 [Pseudomonas batumici]|uniref:Uncharacterized protein n=1 Tax=Pseudomonas batumici TaxID=226910 RepID=A0A0C2I4Q5_9PSED|nr:hypothetical protein UCMB321_4270 [Pseudomonas batumici]